MSDTPRMKAAQMAAMEHITGDVYHVGCDIERELNAANERIRLLIAERDTARRQADQQYNLREEFLDLLGTVDVEQGVAVVREMKERIKRLEAAGDAMLNAWLMPEDSMEYCDWIALSADAKAKWYKAKEAKP